MFTTTTTTTMDCGGACSLPSNAVVVFVSLLYFIQRKIEVSPRIMRFWLSQWHIRKRQILEAYFHARFACTSNDNVMVS